MISHPEVFQGSASYPDPSPGPVLTIGNFDGVHRGHRILLDRVVARAREVGRPACVYTFDPAPRDVLRPGNPILRIQTLEDRLACLGRAGIDQVVVERFTLEVGAMKARDFAAEILGRRLGVSALVVGYDFRFGHKRQGTVDDLRQWLDVPVEQVGPYAPGGELISSSRIREAVKAGRVAEAATLLARPHVVSGRVVRGDARGRDLGYPTANVAARTPLVPADGIYVVRIDIGDGTLRPAVASIGVRPTFDDGLDRRVEVHLLDFDGDLYDREVHVHFLRFLRGEEAFDSVEALVSQMALDAAAARAVLEAE